MGQFETDPDPTFCIDATEYWIRLREKISDPDPQLY